MTISLFLLRSLHPSPFSAPGGRSRHGGGSAAAGVRAARGLEGRLKPACVGDGALHLRPFSVIVNRLPGAFSPTVRSHAVMCARSATDPLTSRPFVPLPRGTFHHRSYKLLGSSVPLWRRAGSHTRHDGAHPSGGRFDLMPFSQTVLTAGGPA